MTEIKYDADVLIVGGGPSGSVCAYYLAKAGKKVILIDSENFPRDKICGDFVSPIGLNELKKIGIWELDGFENTNLIFGASVFLNGEYLITNKLPYINGLPNYGRVIPRVILDNWIVEAARKQGAEIVTPCKLKHYSVNENHVMIVCELNGNEKHFIAKILIGADGSNSKVARIFSGKKLKPENKIVAVRAYFENLDCHSTQAELFFSSQCFPGYYWFFPTSATTANVGIGMMLENFPKEEKNLQSLFRAMIENDLTFKAKIGKGKMVNRIVGFPLSIYNPKATIVKDRVLLVGDAAGLVNSINGEGMQYAMQSGRWAAESIIKCLISNNLSAKSLKIYETKVRSEIGFDMSVANIVMQFIRNRNLNALWLKLLSIMIAQAKRDKKYANIAGGILAGMIPTSTAIKFYFVRKSLFRGMIISFSGKFGIFKFLKSTTLFIATSLTQALKQRADYWNWLKSIFKAAFATISIYFTLKFLKNN
jgi:geranylgeranyl reductase family protein